MADVGLWLIVLAFVGWEALAHFTGNKRFHTLSNRIWKFEGHSLLRRTGILAACLILALHLVFHLF